ncbi:uncharacterized protein LOC142977633 [Anticarsia gemmatalis]|uniref:uncharacterized protein LOC142977633 n=1 Tax=Anticarsia gemmatalis TaxID=129554 RepID=UPI003F759098
MSKTPTKTDQSQYKPREITTPNKDQHGIAKLVYSHVSRLYGLTNDWVKMREKGVRLCKAITSLKLHECMDDYFPSQLRSLMEGLLEILESFKNIIDAIRILESQLVALSKLQPPDEPVISTWSAEQISKSVTDIFESLQKEYKLKEVIIENVAHCRDEKLIEVYISAWELEVYFNHQSYAYLFAEVGLTGGP